MTTYVVYDEGCVVYAGSSESPATALFQMADDPRLEVWDDAMMKYETETLPEDLGATQ